MKTVAAAALAAILGLSATAQAGEAPASLPLAYVVHKLTADGVQLRKLEMGHGVYEARVDAADGTIVKVGVDPLTAELTDAYSHAPARRADGEAPRLDAAQAIQAVAYTGHWDVREVEYEHGAWRVLAGDDAGQTERFSVDAVNGTVK